MIINDNIFNVLPSLEDCSQNLVYCDPPYNLGSKWQIQEDNSVEVKGKAVDFMNNKWEGLTGSDLETMFAELFRVTKHGGFCCMWSLNRQHLPFLYYANKAGWEQLQSINTFVISSFPKSLNISKALDKHYGLERTETFIREDFYKRSNKNNFETNSVGIQGEKGVYTKAVGTLAKKYDGWHSSVVPLKEVSETLLVFRKPFKHGTVVSDIIAKEENNETDIHGCGINIDGNRVSTSQQDIDIINAKASKNITSYDDNCFKRKYSKSEPANESGRYPANLYLSDGFNYTPEQIKEIIESDRLHIFQNIGIDIEPLQYMQLDKQVEYICNYLDKFEVSRILDEQSGVTKSTGHFNSKVPNNNFFKNKGIMQDDKVLNDEGGCSRVVHKCKYELEEFDIFNFTQKVSQFERNAGCSELEDIKFAQSNGANQAIEEGKENYLEREKSIGLNNIRVVKNNHPTLKNMNLNYKILNLFMPPEENKKDFKVCIPFCGVLSEYLPTMALGISEENITGIELGEDYCNIGEARKKFWKDNDFFFKYDKEKFNKEKEKVNKKDVSLKKNLIF